MSHASHLATAAAPSSAIAHVCLCCAAVQGSHPCYSKFKNFFTFRLSPLVSGGVYCAYLAYILVLLPKAFDYHNDAVGRVSRFWVLHVVFWSRSTCLLVEWQGGRGATMLVAVNILAPAEPSFRQSETAQTVGLPSKSLCLTMTFASTTPACNLVFVLHSIPAAATSPR